SSPPSSPRRGRGRSAAAPPPAPPTTCTHAWEPPSGFVCRSGYRPGQAAAKGRRIFRKRRGFVLLAPLPPDRIVAVWQSAVAVVQGGTSVMRTLAVLCAV